MDLLFLKKKNRDKFWKNLSKEEKARHKRTTVSNQLLNPAYVEDYEEVTGRETSTGFGARKEHFGKLYPIEKKVRSITEDLI